MIEKIRNQISDKTFSKISQLEITKSKVKQNKIAQEIICELDIEDFTPYMAYDDEGNMYIALNYYYSSNGIKESLLAQKHDVEISSQSVYIEDVSFLEEFKSDYFNSIKIQSEEELDKKINIYINEKEYDQISQDLDFYNNHLVQVANFERPKCIGNYQKIIEIDEEIEFLENKTADLENKLSNLS